MLETILADTPRSGSGTAAVLADAVDTTLGEAAVVWTAIVGAVNTGAGVVAGADVAAEGVDTEAAVTAGRSVLAGVAETDTVADGAAEACVAGGLAAVEAPLAALGVGVTGAAAELALKAESGDAVGASPLAAELFVGAPFVAGPVDTEEGAVANAVLVCGFAP